MTGGTASAVRNHTTAMRGSGCGRGDGGDEMSPSCSSRPGHQHAPDDRRHG